MPVAAPCVACQVLSIAPDQVRALPAALKGVSVAIRVTPGAAPPATSLDEIRRRGGRPVVHLTAIPAPEDAWLAANAAAFAIEANGTDADRVAFDLKRALSSARGHRPAARLLVSAPPALAAALGARGLDPYLDGFVPPPLALPVAAELFAPVKSDTTVIRTLPSDLDAAAAIVSAAAATVSWFPSGLVPVADRPLRCGGDRRIDAYLDPQTLGLVGTSESCPAPAIVTSDMPGATAERLDIGGLSAFRVSAEGGDRFAEGVSVAAARTLTADEIIARHQAFAARQASSMRSDIAIGTLTLTFEAPGFVAPITITARTEVFKDAARTDMRQADVRVNGVPFTAKDGVPRLPILEPERVAVVPLTITLSSVYRYSLDGRDTMNGTACYVIAFAPRGDSAGQAAGAASYFSGRAWIDERTFAIIRVAAAQTGLKGPIVASEQTDTFAPDAAGRWLLARSDIRQTYEGASVRTPIHRLLAIDRHEVNAPDFAARRDAAYASTDVILRDTPEGFRYLKREPGAASHEAATGSGPLETATRTLAPPITRVPTLAMGVIIDPNISTPLPFAGVSYVDFDLFHTGTQFSGFFGGSYAQLAFSAPSIAGTRWQIAGRAFAIATSYNDREFVDGREIYARDIRQQPAQAAVWVLRPVAARAAVRFEYDWDYNRFSRNDETDPAFVVPRNQNAHGLRAGIDVQLSGWQTSLWASHTMRVDWQPWGTAASAPDAVHPSFQRAGVSVQRTASVSPRLAARLDAGVVAGRNMDRFSRIAFGTFDNRLHGYPSALIRYDRGGVVRSALSWTAAKALRLDGFADTAFVHDPAFGHGLRNFTGFGAALEVPGPFGTLAAVEWGYGVQGVNTNGRTGTQVVRITGYKVF